MNFWEQFAVTIFAGLLAGLHLNTSAKGLLANILIPIRDTLNVLYPPSAPASPVSPAV